MKFKPVVRTGGAAHEIETLGEDIDRSPDAENLRSIPGVGSNLAGKIREILETGKLAHLEKLKQDLPKGVLELSEIGGIGLKKALILSRELGIIELGRTGKSG